MRSPAPSEDEEDFELPSLVVAPPHAVAGGGGGDIELGGCDGAAATSPVAAEAAPATQRCVGGRAWLTRWRNKIARVSTPDVAPLTHARPRQNIIAVRAFDVVTAPITAVLDLVAFVSQLQMLLGTRLFASLSIAYFLAKGVAVTVQDSVVFPLYKDTFHVADGGEFQQLASIVMLAWAMKPVIGMLSDRVPILGYRKRWYLVAAGVFGCVCYVVVLLLPPERSWSKLLLTAALFGANLGYATTDLLCEGTYARLMVLRPRVGAGMVSWMWGLVNASGVIACLLVGPLSDAGMAPLCLALMIPFMAVPAALFAANWLREKPVLQLPPALSFPSPSHSLESQTGSSPVIAAEMAEPPPERAATMEDETTATARRVGRYSMLMGAVAPTTAICTLMAEGKYVAFPQLLVLHRDSPSWHATVASSTLVLPIPLLATALSAVALACAAWRWLPRAVAKVSIYMFLKEGLYISCAGPLNYFFVADDTCVPDGPHFSYTFYNTTTQIVSSISGAIGAFAFFMLFARRRFADVFVVTTCLKLAASFFDLIIVKRWNRTVLGISDAHAYMFGDAIVYPICARLDFMAAVALYARLCPKGLESSMYAALAGFSNFGVSVSGALGAELTRVLGVRTYTIDATTGTAGSTHAVAACDFSNLGSMILIAHGLTPVVALLLAYPLLPNDIISPEEKSESDSHSA